ncbi:DUF6371 domain-containing protein [Sphingobacterium sp. UT-1RO-CII-1]|uniref:DUF6371 domain-containing protein n=1 Tax=Sphingobacterium sp. UT-1RO-CII-1 TaxID=2995225 RepID=UPI00227AD093|nr:DUF6371 domain-containing protein [Sphingobacterium sp. UT-1RO-CII-1]MCY4781694.1 DUF6371 domain-containing protein [Sphingobacterium sp. UT-1RO-CII-1]
MAVDFKFKLDTSSKKFRCPNCGKKTFVRYRDEKGNYAADIFGRCDREVNCGYLNIPDNEKVIVAPKIQRRKKLMFIDYEDAVKTSTRFEENNLINFLVDKLGYDAVDAIVERYRIGIDQTFPTTQNWIIWWQFDVDDNCRSGKLMKYGPDGRRDKSQSSTWYHKVNPKYKGFEVTQCFFGEHLIVGNQNKIAIVESEKTACIASHFMPEFIWLASGSLTGLGYHKCKVLKHRHVTLFPDLGAFDKWKVKASEYGWNISRALEDRATADERELGLDIADYLI